MDRTGRWKLSPAFDVSYAYAPQGAWTQQHQMSLNAKRDGFETDDLKSFANNAGLKPAQARTLLEQARAAISNWPQSAESAGVPADQAVSIGKAHRLI
mgnify:FL=1